MSDWSKRERSGGFDTLSARSYGVSDSVVVTRVGYTGQASGVDPYSLFELGDASVSLPNQPWLEVKLPLAVPAMPLEDEYTRAEGVLSRDDLDEDEAEDAADRLVRYGLFLCRERVEPVIARLIREAPHVEARRLLVDILADYDVPLSDALRESIRSRLDSSHNGEFLGALAALLRDARDGASDLLEQLRAGGKIGEGRSGLATRALERLIREGSAG
jgi:hypothetical protein